MKWKSALFVTLLAFSLLAPAPPATPSLKLVLVLSIDQMRYDYLTRFGDLFQGGFKRLLRAGAVFSNANYHHACTETGPGHSVLLTGRHPSHSGIVANAWYDPFQKKLINVVDDPLYPAVGGKGRAAAPTNMIGPTVGDLMKGKSPSAKVVGISMKDRSAILMGGHLADAAYWYETSEGRMVTSSYYMKSAPEWLQKWNAKPYPDQFAGTKWERLKNDAALYEKYAGKDAEEGESDRKDIVFPHLIPSMPPDKKFYEGFRYFPNVDEMTLEAALRAMDAHEIGKDIVTDLFAIGFSATDVIGHAYGPDSQEMMDQMLRLDALLGRLFDEVDRRQGVGNTLVVLSADHGVLPLVEILQRKGLPAKRVSPSILSTAINKALTETYPGVTDLIAADNTPYLYLNKESIRSHKLQLQGVEQTITKALLATGIVGKVYTQSDFINDPPANDPDYALFRNTFFAPRSADLIVSFKPYIYCDDYPGGTGHGTQYEYDRHVPVLFMGPGIKPGLYPDAAGPEDIAPTLDAILGLDMPKEDDARVLTEMMH